jgi:hypothetical protein
MILTSLIARQLYPSPRFEMLQCVAGLGRRQAHVSTSRWSASSRLICRPKALLSDFGTSEEMLKGRRERTGHTGTMEYMVSDGWGLRRLPGPRNIGNRCTGTMETIRLTRRHVVSRRVTCSTQTTALTCQV